MMAAMVRTAQAHVTVRMQTGVTRWQDIVRIPSVLQDIKVYQNVTQVSILKKAYLVFSDILTNILEIFTVEHV